MQDNKHPVPDLWLRFYIAGSPQEQKQFAEMLVRSNSSVSRDVDGADVVIFTGGPDVDPQLYGETRHESTQVDPNRDTADLKLYHECFEKGIPMLGICRGAQFLHVMNGGKLFQDVDNHYGDHDIFDNRLGRLVRDVSSVHHQMVIADAKLGIDVIATAAKSKKRFRNATDYQEGGNNQDVEAFFYRDTCCLGIQGHPEYRGYSEFAEWSIKLIEEYVVTNTDVDWVGCHRRLRPEILSERETRWASRPDFIDLSLSKKKETAA